MVQPLAYLPGLNGPRQFVGEILRITNYLNEGLE